MAADRLSAHADDHADDIGPAATLLGLAAAQRADPRLRPGILEPGPDPRADALIDRSTGEAALLLWEAGVAAGGPPPSSAQSRSPELIATAAAAWRVSGRAGERDARGVHPVQQLAIERFAIIGERATMSQPLCPELDTGQR
ncbi:hypothetical protein ACFV1N_25370 [Streptosporangium canum]|uniref:hypothetical protein n=1 Tax=Streptosporangium canum TaxID=324952 RepID=UPI003693819F